MNAYEIDRFKSLVRNFAMERMASINSSHGFDHVERVELLASRISKTEIHADALIVSLSALLHDIARIDEIKSGGKTCHAALGSEIAYEFLLDSGLPEKTASHVRDCVLTHRYRDNRTPSSIEAKIIYDSDKLDSIGAVGIGRAFLFSGEIGAKLHDPKIDIITTEAYGKEDTAYREFLVKLRHIKDKMMTAEGSLIAQARNSFMEEFFSRLNLESSGLG
jgi:uncharacterized protein